MSNLRQMCVIFVFFFRKNITDPQNCFENNIPQPSSGRKHGCYQCTLERDDIKKNRNAILYGVVVLSFDLKYILLKESDTISGLWDFFWAENITSTGPLSAVEKTVDIFQLNYQFESFAERFSFFFHMILGI